MKYTFEVEESASQVEKHQFKKINFKEEGSRRVGNSRFASRVRGPQHADRAPDGQPPPRHPPRPSPPLLLFRSSLLARTFPRARLIRSDRL